MELLKWLTVAYLIGINIFGFTLLRIQKKEAIFETTAGTPEPKKHKKEEEAQQNEIRSSETAEAPNSTSSESSDTIEHTENLSNKPQEDDLTKEQVKKELKKDKSKKRVRDFMILFVSAIGGALAVYIGMFMMRYKLKNMLLMIFNPVFIGLHLYLVIFLFQNYIIVA